MGQTTPSLLLLLVPAVLLAFVASSGSSVVAVILVGALAGLWGLVGFLWFASRGSSILSATELVWFALVGVLLFATFAANSHVDGILFGLEMKLLVSLVMWSVWISVIPQLAGSRERLDGLVKALDILGIMISLSMLLPRFGLSFGELQGQGAGLVRSFGPFGDSAPFVAALFACRALVAHRWFSLALHLAALLAAVGLGALMTLSVALAAHLLLPWPGRARRRITWKGMVVAVLAVPVLLFVLLLVGQGVVERLADPRLVTFTFATRLGSMLLALEVIGLHPFTGVGFNGFFSVAETLQPERYFIGLFDPNYYVQVPNQLLQTATDAGVPGVLALVGFYWVVLRELYRASARGSAQDVAFRGYFIWTVGLFVGNQSAAWLLPMTVISFILFIVVGLGVAANRSDSRPATGESRCTTR